MSAITYVRLRYWFYPLGNTPAVSLLRDIYAPPDTCVKILCVACGDVRSLLFTLWLDQAAAGRKYEFTTCDAEPAVLARNILLLSILAVDTEGGAGQVEASVLWELYYHLFITKSAMKALQTHVTKLLEASESLEDWYGSPYGKSLRFLDDNTLSEVRQYWQLYHSGDKDMDREYRQGIRQAFSRSGASTGGNSVHGLRSTGIHSLVAANVMGDAFRNYWETGVVAGNSNDVQALEREGGGRVNPLFAHSSAASGKFAVHYGTDPLPGFHLAEVFDHDRPQTELPNRLSEAVKSQFRAWCRSCAAAIRNETLRVTFYCGEAISLCHALQERLHIHPNLSRTSSSYVRPWSARTLHLEDPGVFNTWVPYDVIDSSNLSDHVGVLNLLPAAVPLLRNTTHSVLYTETLLRGSDNIVHYFDDLFRTDIASLSTIAGLIPVSTVLGTSVEHHGFEIILNLGKGQRAGQSPWRVRVAWQKPYGGDDRVARLDERSLPSVRADPEELASWFVRWYVDIFTASENIAHQFSALAVNPGKALSGSLNHYSRITLVSLLGLAKKNLHSDWPTCVRAFLRGVAQERSLLVGSNSLQELNTLLHLSGLYTVPALGQPPQASALEFTSGGVFPVPSCLSGFSELPSIVHLVLTVPRHKLHVFTSAELDRIGTPGLHLSVYNEDVFENCFYTPHTCFGKLIVSSDDCNVATIQEDKLGWRGQSDMIVVAAVPTFQFLVSNKANTHVALVVNTSLTSMYFTLKLGMHLRVYSASIDKGKNLHLLRSPPGILQGSHGSSPETHGQVRPVSQPVSISAREGRLEVFTIRVACLTDEERKELTEGCVVTTIQETPCTLTIQLGSHSKVIQFPSPTDGTHSRTKVSRKECWIEVTIPSSLATQPNGYKLDPFPVVLQQDRPVAWGMAKAILDRHPIIPLHCPLSFLNGFLGMTMSRAEKMVERGEHGASSHVAALLELKKTIATLIQGFRGQDNSTAGAGKRWKAFRLAQNNNSDLLIFAASLRHDRDLGSICLDAYIVPLTNDRVQRMSALLTRAVNLQELLSINVTVDEEILWKRVLPSLVERCRVSWEHRPACEYGTDPFVCPRSLSHGQMSVCSCGEGKDTQGMPAEYSGFAPYATRVAIAPISAVPFVEPMALTAVLESEGRIPPATANRIADYQVEVCDRCKVVGFDLKSCSKCLQVKYCGKNCQKAAWKGHKAQCKKPAGQTN